MKKAIVGIIGIGVALAIGAGTTIIVKKKKGEITEEQTTEEQTTETKEDEEK